MTVDAPVGVVIVTYNSSELIEACLDTLGPSAPTRLLEVVVVDNDSDDDVVDRARAHPISPTVIATGRNGGYAAGVNVGLHELTHAHSVLILNPDCRLDPGAIDRLADELDACGAGVTAPLIREPDGRVSWSLYRDPTLIRAFGDGMLGTERAGRHPLIGEQETRPESYVSAHDVAWASGAVLLVSRHCLDTVGPWDEQFFLYSEESDFQMRATRSGHRIRFIPEATSVHDGGDSAISDRLWAMLIVNKIRLYRKYHGPIATLFYRVPVIATEAVRALRGRGPSRAALAALFSSSRARALFATD